MKKALCVVLVGLLAQVASANLLVNGDFEQPVLAPGTEVAVSSGQVQGWSSLLASPAVGNYPGSIYGNNTNIAYTTANGFMIQMAGEIQPNTTYTLTADIGPSIYWYGLSSFAGVEIAEFNSSGNFVADLAYVGYAGPNPIADPGPGNMTKVTVTYTTGDTVTAGNQIVVALGINQTPEGGRGAIWDNVVLTANAVPEPATMGLLVLGSIAGLLRRRK